MVTVVQFFRFLFDEFWNFLGSLRIFNGVSYKALFISFLFFLAVWGFVFHKIIKTGD